MSMITIYTGTINSLTEFASRIGMRSARTDLIPRALLLTVFVFLIASSHQTTEQASAKAGYQSAQSDKKQRQEIKERIERYRASFSKGRWMLLKKNVPFDPDMLTRPQWRKALRSILDQMPEMKAIRREAGPLSGVYMADTLHLPGEVKTQGDILILARKTIFEGPNPVIRGEGNVYLYFIEPPEARTTVGMLRRSNIQQVSFRGSGPFAIGSSSSGTLILSDCELRVDTSGRKGDTGNKGTTLTNKPATPTGVPPKASDGDCFGDRHGQPGDMGFRGTDGVDGGTGEPGPLGQHATGDIICDIPDGDTNSYSFNASGGEGGDGGQGGDGQPGGDGGKGGKGGTGANCCSVNGIMGNGGTGGIGGRGGNGGSGGKGGLNGKGGDAKNIIVTYPARWTGSYRAVSDGGQPGRAGGGGFAGAPGDGGLPGDPGDAAPGPTCGLGTKPGDPGSKGPVGTNIGVKNGAWGEYDPNKVGESRLPSVTPRSGTDNDGDGWAVEEGDCNDGDSSTYPGAPIETTFCNAISSSSEDRNCNGSSDQQECLNGGGYSPIIINFSGGLKLTSPQDGVLFDITASGTKVQISWTLPGSDDAFLVLDRNGNGEIDDGSELFGNATLLGNGQLANNGFEALGWYDVPANGGNGNGLIDAADQIFSELRVWQDFNHNGISEANELHTLTEVGIASIEVEYQYSKRQDQYGNVYRYRAKVYRIGEKSSHAHQRFAYDVFFVTAKSSTGMLLKDRQKGLALVEIPDGGVIEHRVGLMPSSRQTIKPRRKKECPFSF